MNDDFNQSNQGAQPEKDAAEEQPYKPFNQYETPPAAPYQQPPVNPYQQPYQVNQPYQRPENSYQQQPYQPPQGYQQPFATYTPVYQPAKGLGIASFLCSLFSALCCGYLPPLGFIGLITAIVARVKGNRSGLTVASIVLGCIGIVLTLWIGYSVIVVGSNPSYFRSLLEEILREIYY